MTNDIQLLGRCPNSGERIPTEWRLIDYEKDDGTEGSREVTLDLLNRFGGAGHTRPNIPATSFTDCRRDSSPAVENSEIRG